MIQAPETAEAEAEEQGPGPHISIPPAVIVSDLAGLLGVTPIDVIKELMKNGVMATINQVVDFDTAAVVAADLGFSPDEEGSEEAAPEVAADAAPPVSLSRRIVEEGEGLVARPPVVTVLGHVDHGKTTLLDAIRRANVVAGEAGGITQHIGAYQATAPDGRTITFIDTPGHAAFSEMRARGAQITDVAIIVVAADDGLMPQTREAINHARAAEVPIVVAMNKTDLPNANPERATQQLMEVQLVPEEFGGDTPVVAISALKAEGIDELLENVLLVADLNPQLANPNRDAIGVVIEASTDPRRGIATTILVQTGTLHAGDVVRAGLAFGKVKAMTDSAGRRMQEAGPSVPVTVLGLSEVPPAGERVVTVKDEKTARAEVESERRALEGGGTPQLGVTLDSLFGEIHSGAIKDFNIVLKTDVQGSIEPLVRAIEALAVDEINVKVIHASAGTVNESDVNLAVASQGVIVAFNTRAETGAQRLADTEQVEIREYRIIYDIVEDVEKAVQGLLEPIFEERQDGVIEVRAVFRRGRRNTIAGCFVREGTVANNSLTRVMRGGKVEHESRIDTLKRFQDDAREVTAGQECGVTVTGFEDFAEGDEIVAYHMEQTR
ncbi:MAG: translation initiation factor IF-2 [Chloroflexi bacterium]|nr:translation initiation factor IF-2 [Chloroflexota bacterium]